MIATCKDCAYFEDHSYCGYQYCEYHEKRIWNEYDIACSNFAPEVKE